MAVGRRRNDPADLRVDSALAKMAELQKALEGINSSDGRSSGGIARPSNWVIGIILAVVTGLLLSGFTAAAQLLFSTPQLQSSITALNDRVGQTQATLNSIGTAMQTLSLSISRAELNNTSLGAQINRTELALGEGNKRLDRLEEMQRSQAVQAATRFTELDSASVQRRLQSESAERELRVNLDATRQALERAIVSLTQSDDRAIAQQRRTQDQIDAIRNLLMRQGDNGRVQPGMMPTLPEAPTLQSQRAHPVVGLDIRH